MNIGISTSCFYPMLTEDAFALVCDKKVGLTEIFFNALSELDPDFCKTLYSKQKESGIKVGSIHPTMSLAESFMLFSAYKRRFDEGIEQYKRYADICCNMGAKYIIMHGGKPNKVINNEQYFEMFGNVFETVKKYGATVLQENVVDFRAGNLQTLKDMNDYLGESVAFCLDVKQSVRGGYDPNAVIELLGDKIKHLHVSDNTKDCDCLAPLAGNFDFGKFFENAEKNGFKGNAIVEVYDWSYGTKQELFDNFFKFQKKFQKTIDK